MPRPPKENPDCDFSADYPAGYELLLSGEQIPPYDLDSIFNDPKIRKRIGELITRAMKNGSWSGCWGPGT